MKTKKYYTVAELWDNIPRVNSLYQNSDTICVILGASFIDRCLADAIVVYMPTKDKDFIKNELLDSGNGVLDTYASRNKIAYALKIIDKQYYEDISLIGKIRNRFAHHHIELSFNDTEVISFCNRLTLWEKRFPPYQVSEFKLSPSSNDPIICKEKFVYSVTEIINKFIAKGFIHKIIHE
jgi:DNA-binding MltR family transcriptional regulator